MREIILPESYNYIAVFLSLDCNYDCGYCINRFGDFKSGLKSLSGREWVRGLNRIALGRDLPITLQGGEPSLHRDFIYIINNLKPELKIDILTNLQFDLEEFIKKVSPSRLKRDAPYASIRVSFHPQTMDLDATFKKSLTLLKAGFSLGIWAVDHPQYREIISKAKALALETGIDFRTKEFLGYYEGRFYGTYKYRDACEGKLAREASCRTTELILGPDGAIYRCHSDIYASRQALGNILEEDLEVSDRQRPCNYFGYCNPCDVKIKTNRFQEYGYTAVDIQLIR